MANVQSVKNTQVARAISLKPANLEKELKASIQHAKARAQEEGAKGAAKPKVTSQSRGEAKAAKAAVEAKAPKAPKAKAPTIQVAMPSLTRGCACGCGEQVTRTFKPGHDAKLKSRLLAEARAAAPAAE